MDGDADQDVELAERLLAAWDQGRGVSKSELERQTWGDGSSHGRRFDRFVGQTLGVATNRPSRQTDLIAELKRQVRGLGGHPSDEEPEPWLVQLQHARDSCIAAVRVWNDPVGKFRTGSFSLLFVTAWNSLAIAVIQLDGGEWRKLDGDGQPLMVNGAEQALDTGALIVEAFKGDENLGLRENVRFWIDLRNSVAHRHLPALDSSVIPYAQAGLLNIERALVDLFGSEYALSECLSVPLQLSGFRDPTVLASRRRLMAALPLDVQALLGRADHENPSLLADETFLMRVAFVPVVPSSGRNPDAVAYFVKPGEVPSELAESLDRYVVLPKSVRGPRPNLGAKDVVAEVSRRIPFRFNTIHHAAAGRALGVRPPVGEEERSLNEQYCDYVTAGKIYVYNQLWIDRLVKELSTEAGFLKVTGRVPVRSEESTASDTAEDGAEV